MGKMDEQREVIIDIKANAEDALANIVKLTNANAALRKEAAEVRQEQASLEKQFKAAGGATAEQSARYDELTARLVTNRREQAANSAAIGANTKAVDLHISSLTDAAGSLNALRKQSAEMSRQYAAMSAEERKAAKESGFTKKLKEVNDQIRAATTEVGNFKDNIGNYQSAIAGVVADTGGLGKALRVVGVDIGKVGGGAAGLKSGFAAVGGAAKGFGASLKVLAANPFFVTIGIVAGLVKALQTAISDNAAASAAWGRVMKSVEPVFAAVGKAVSTVGEYVAKFVEQMTRAAEVVAKFVARAADWFGGLVGAEVGAEKALSRYVGRADAAARRMEEIRRRSLLLTSDEARAAMEVAQLREKAEDTSIKSIGVRISYLDKAIKKEQEIADKRAELARLQLEEARENLEQNRDSLALQEAFHSAEAAAFAAEKERAEKYKDLRNQRLSFLKEARDAAKAAADEAARLNDAMAAAAAGAAKATKAMAAAARELETANDLADIAEREAAVLAAWEKEAAGAGATAEAAEAVNERLKALAAERAAVMTAAENDRYAAALEALRSSEADTEAVFEMEEQMAREHQRKLSEIAAAGAAAVAASAGTAVETQEAAARTMAAAAEQALGGIGAALSEAGEESRAAFEVGKAANVATATIDTYKAAQSSYAALAGIPVVGPALGAAAAAAAIVAGVARVKKITATKFGGGGAPSAGDGSASTGAGGGSPASSAGASAAQSGAFYDFANLEKSALPSAGGAAQTAAPAGLTRADMVAAIKAMPAPVVAVRDISDAQAARAERVAVLNP